MSSRSRPVHVASLVDLLLLHSRTAAVVLDAEGRVITASARWRSLMPSLSDAAPGTPVEALCPSLPPAALARLRAVCAGDVPRTTIRLSENGGTPYWLAVTAGTTTDPARAYDVPVVLVERLDEVEWHRAHPDQAISLLDAALDSTTDGLLIVDRRGTIVRTNRRFWHMWRLPPEMAAERSDGRLLDHVLPQVVDPDGFLARIRELYAHPDDESADVIRFHDGRVYERYSIPQRVRGLVIGRVWSFRDITTRVEAERERDRLEAQLRQHAKLESLATMAGGIAHDFNNLLLEVIGHADLLLEDLPARSPYRGRVQQVHDAAERAAQLTGRMLAYAGRVDAQIEPVDAVAVVRDVETELRAGLSAGTTLSIDSQPCPRVRADARLLRDALRMLVTNAREALDGPGQIRVGVEPLQVTDADLRACYFSALTPGSAVQIVVADTGHGMDERALARAFDPFFSTRFQGRGLGLPFVLGIVRAHHGAIAVESASGRGTTVRLLLPAETS